MKFKVGDKVRIKSGGYLGAPNGSIKYIINIRPSTGNEKVIIYEIRNEKSPRYPLKFFVNELELAANTKRRIRIR